jgi:hypothetical protein
MQGKGICHSNSSRDWLQMPYAHLNRGIIVTAKPSSDFLTFEGFSFKPFFEHVMKWGFLKYINRCLPEASA